MKIDKFEDIIAWKKSKELTLSIYRALQNNKDFAFKDQIQRAATSIMNNIAEGFERKEDKKFMHFLFIAKGSCAETRFMLYLALELQYISQKQFNEAYQLSVEISKILSGLIKSF